MALPASRDLTATAASQVPSTLHNVLQDCIIGNKHGALSLVIPASAFILPTGFLVSPTNPLNGSLADRHVIAGTFTLMAPVLIPFGTRMQSVTFYYTRGGAGSIVTRWRRRTVLDNVTAQQEIVAPATDSASGAWGANSIMTAAAGGYSALATESVWLEVSGGSGGNIIGPAVVAYDRP